MPRPARPPAPWQTARGPTIREHTMEFVMYIVMFATFTAGMGLTVNYDRNGGTFAQWVAGYILGALALGMFIAMIIVSNI